MCKSFDKYHVGLKDDLWYIDVDDVFDGDDKDLQSIKDLTLVFADVEETKRESEKKVIFEEKNTKNVKTKKYTKCAWKYDFLICLIF